MCLQMFGRKYSRIAETYPMTSFLEVIGDESADTRVRIPACRFRLSGAEKCSSIYVMLGCPHAISCCGTDQIRIPHCC